MKKLLFAAALAACSLAADAVMYEGVNIPQLPERFLNKKINPKSPMARIIAKAKADGGFLRGRVTTGKTIRFIDAQKTISDAPMEAFAADAFRIMQLPVETVKEDPKDGRAAVTVYIEERDDDTTLLIAPDNQYAKINVKALSKGLTDKTLIEGRVRKELWRACVYTLGGGNTRSGQDVLRLITKPEDLDARPDFMSSPEPFHTISEAASKLGMGRVGYVTYRQACLQGWAPAPTTEAEKRVWDECMKEGQKNPANPIKIKYDPKAGK